MKKKFLSLVLAVIMIFAVLVPTASAFEPTADKLASLPRTDDVIVRFVVGSDLHLGYTEAEAKLRNAYDAMKKLGGVDAFIAAGDLTEGGLPEELALFQSIVAENSEKLTVEIDGFSGTGAGEGAAVGTTIAMLGNHENYNADIETDFRAAVGQETEGIYWLGGKVPVIKVSMTNEGATDWPSSFETKHDYIVSAVKEVVDTGYKGHIFLISHIAFAETVFGSEVKGEDRYAPETVEFLKDYPQIVHISGHSHATPYNPGVIDQSAGFTSIVTGTVGKWYRQSADNVYGSSFTVFDVKNDGTCELHRVDLQTGELIYGNEKWILDSSDTPEDFIYFADPSKAINPDYYAKDSSAPSYGESSVTALDMGDHDSVEVTFTANAVPASDKNYDYVEHYTVRATPVNGGDVISREVYNDPAVISTDKLTVKLFGLEYDTDYEISVAASTAFDNESEPVKADNIINVGTVENTTVYPVEPMYRVDYSAGDKNEQFGHALTSTGTITVKDVPEIGKKAASFRGIGIDKYDFDIEDIDALRNGFTLETYFMPAATKDYQTVVGIAGADLNIGIADGKLDVYMEVTAEKDSYTVSGVPINENEWVHVVVTYDGKRARIYKNGILAVTELHSGGLADADDPELKLRVGASELTSDNLAKGSYLNMFCLSRGVMTDDDVAVAYEKTTGKNVVPFKDVGPKKWFADAVKYVYLNGLMNGKSDTAFAPNEQMTRAQLVSVLWRLAGSPEVEFTARFTDVKKSKWFAGAVMWAAENGIVDGFPDGRFAPDDSLTRDQLAAILFRYTELAGGDISAEGDLSKFTDAKKVQSWARPAVKWAVGEGIIAGKPDGDSVAVAPKAFTTRAEVATVIMRYTSK